MIGISIQIATGIFVHRERISHLFANMLRGARR